MNNEDSSSLLDLKRQLDELTATVNQLRDKRIYQQDVVPNIPLRKPLLIASSNSLITAIDAATVVFDLNSANIQTVTLGGNRILALKNVSLGQRFTLRLIQDPTGSRTVSWFTVIHWPSNNTPPTLTTTANRWDDFEFICTARSTTVAGGFIFDGLILGQNLS